MLFTGLGVAATTAFVTPPTPEALSATACVFRNGLGRRAGWAPADAPAFVEAGVELSSSLLVEAAAEAGLPGPGAAAGVIVFDEDARFMRRAFLSASSFACLRLSSISLASMSAVLKPLVLPGTFCAARDAIDSCGADFVEGLLTATEGLLAPGLSFCTEGDRSLSFDTEGDRSLSFGTEGDRSLSFGTDGDPSLSFDTDGDRGLTAGTDFVFCVVAAFGCAASVSSSWSSSSAAGASTEAAPSTVADDGTGSVLSVFGCGFGELTRGFGPTESRFLLGVTVSDAGGCEGTTGLANGDVARAGTFLTAFAAPGDRFAPSGDLQGDRRASSFGLLLAFAALTAFLGVACVVLEDAPPLAATGTSQASEVTAARLLGCGINQVPTEGKSFHGLAFASPAAAIFARGAEVGFLDG